MRKWTRPDEPAELRAKRSALTRDFIAEKRRTGKTPLCDWPKVRNLRGDLETMQEMFSRLTNQHCSYCDSYMGHSSRDTIDHFAPKSKFGYQAYRWRNLYHCCDGCQKKGTRYDKMALRPDEEGYEFALYFRYRRDGTIQVIAVDDNGRQRAEATITLFGLNNQKLVSHRAIEFARRLKPRERPLPSGVDHETARRVIACRGNDSFDDLPFRDWYDQASGA